MTEIQIESLLEYRSHLPSVHSRRDPRESAGDKELRAKRNESKKATLITAMARQQLCDESIQQILQEPICGIEQRWHTYTRIKDCCVPPGAHIRHSRPIFPTDFLRLILPTTKSRIDRADGHAASQRVCHHRAYPGSFKVRMQCLLSHEKPHWHTRQGARPVPHVVQSEQR